jgi:hypothetical protein
MHYKDGRWVELRSWSVNSKFGRVATSIDIFFTVMERVCRSVAAREGKLSVHAL